MKNLKNFLLNFFGEKKRKHYLSHVMGGGGMWGVLSWPIKIFTLPEGKKGEIILKLDEEEESFNE